MRHVLAVLIAAAGVLSAPLVSAAPATEPAKPSPAGPSLAPALEPIAFYLGSYTIDATWAFGGGLTARAFYTPGPGGMFVEADIYPSDNGGAFYHRYHSVIAYDPDAHAMTSYDFTFDGSVAVTPITLRTEDGRTVADSTWPNGAIREQLAQQPDGSLAWKAWMRAPDQGDGDATPEWRLIMDDAWEPAPGLERPAAPMAELRGKLAEFAPFLGSWTLDTGGFWSRHTYRPGVGGRFLEIHTEARSPAGEPQAGYTTEVAWDEKAQAYTAYAFLPDGTVRMMPVEVDRGPDGTPRLVSMGWDQHNGPQTVHFRQTYAVPAEDADGFNWKLYTRDDTARDWTERMNGRWRHDTHEEDAAMPDDASKPETAPIDTSLFPAFGAEVRSFVKEAEIDAPPSEVFRFWTEPAEWQRVFASGDLVPEIELAIGGKYEWYFVAGADGSPPIGSNGCQVLSYIPNRLVSFSWNAPPSLPTTRELRTWVVVELEPLAGGARTLCRLTHLGFGQGDAWDQTYDYFDAAWPRVLSLVQAGFAPGED